MDSDPIVPADAVLDAARLLEGVAYRTPVLTSRTLNHLTGCQVYLKCENFQRVGAFKFRGAYNAISRLSEHERVSGVITHSSGNHAQGLALAAKLLDVRATVVMPFDAPANKRAATESYGAVIVPCEAMDREEVTTRLIEEHNYSLIHPFDNENIIAGQGTAALELFQEAGHLDYLFVPVGGGGLISGCALAAQLQSPNCRVVGVEPEAASDAGRSWRAGSVHTLETVPETIADGLRTRAIGRRNLEVMRRFVSDMTSVTESDILATMEFIWSRLKVVVEPSAAVALAPLLSGRYSVPEGSRIGILISGGNVDLSKFGFPSGPPGDVTRSSKREVAGVPLGQPEKKRRVSQTLVCTTIDEHAQELLEAIGPVHLALDLDEESLIARIGDYHAMIVSPSQRISSHVIKYGYNLKAIGSLESHLDNIDVSTARALGIQVFNAPDQRAVTIAEHTVRRLLSLSDRYSDGRLAGKTLGIIGFGLVGRLVAQRAAAFDMRIMVNQPRLTSELALVSGVEATDLVALLGNSDFVSLHVPFTEETDAIIGEDELRWLKPSAMLVNMGHTDLVDEPALLRALNAGKLSGAALSALPRQAGVASPEAAALREHSRVLVSPHVVTVLGGRRSDASLQVAQQIAMALKTRRASETLDLEIVPIEQVVPHEHIDMKRVSRLMERLEDDARLVNPPITTYWKDRYIILDGATRYGSLQRLGYPHVIVQVVDKDQAGFQLHTWYHAISAEEGPEAETHFAQLEARLKEIDGLRLQRLNADEAQNALKSPDALCYFIDRQGQMTLAEAAYRASKLVVMNAIVDLYNAWGKVERTLLTDMDRLLAQFPNLVTVAVFPQFRPEDVFDAAADGNLLPAGLTRFVIPGRILRLNADLERLKRDEPLAEKRAWFNEFLTGKLSRSRLRVYQEPVVLLDE